MAYSTYLSIYGSHVNDELLVDYATVDAMHYFEWGSGQDQMVGLEKHFYAWDRKVWAFSGDDTIKRDQPGDYKPDAVVNLWQTQGNVGIFGGTGSDTVDYSLFQSAVEVDLRPLGQAVANTFDGDVETYFSPAGKGFAKALDPSGVGTFGMDFLSSIENVVGTDWGDHITGDDGANDIDGGDGNDTINGEGGADTIDGGDGNDNIHGDGGTDVIDGGDGNDKIWGGSEDDVINAGDGNDLVMGGTGVDVIGGGDGADEIYGGDQGDIIMGGDGKDTIEGGDGDDQIWGGNQNDLLLGDAGDDTMWGGSGNDQLRGGSGDNTYYGQAGNDKISIENFDALVDGGTGFDIVELTNGGNTDMYVSVAFGGNGYMEQLGAPGVMRTELKDIEAVKTAGGNDVISFSGVGADDNKAYSGYGNDTVSLGNGNDSAWGGAGDDLMKGQLGNDFLDGGDDDDDLRGGYGDDTLLGGEGSDEIRGGKGADVLGGGSSGDTFIWKDGDHGLDALYDFQLGTDKIDVDGFLASPPIAVGESYVGKVAALPTAWAGKTGLYALTDDGWSAFALVDGYDAPTLSDAIATGELFGTSAPLEQGNGQGQGPGRIEPLDRLTDLPGQEIISGEYDILL